MFVEVKLRKSADFAQAREFVTAEKQRRIRTTAGLVVYALAAGYVDPDGM